MDTLYRPWWVLSWDKKVDKCSWVLFAWIRNCGSGWTFRINSAVSTVVHNKSESLSNFLTVLILDMFFIINSDLIIVFVVAWLKSDGWIKSSKPNKPVDLIEKKGVAEWVSNRFTNLRNFVILALLVDAFFATCNWMMLPSTVNHTALS